MTAIQWDQVGEREYETGVDHGVLYPRDNQGNYDHGVAWNGLVSVTESPSGAESNKQYADNIVYLNLISAEEYAATIEAFTYPDEFEECDGTAEIAPGVTIGQQNRRPFGMSYRTLKGNDVLATDFGYKLHLFWGGKAAPTEKAHTTVNDSPEAITFSWEVSTTPVSVPGFKPTATLTLDSTKVDPAKLAELETILYGTDGVDPRLPSPAEVLALFAGSSTEVAPAKPAFNDTTKVLTIPATTGVVYQIHGVTVAAGPITLTEDTVVVAKPAAGYKFPAVTDDDWLYEV